MSADWNAIVFFDGEDPEALKTRFVELSAVYKTRPAFEIAQYVFKDLREPALRAGKAAEVWATDLDVQERIRQLILKGPTVADCTESDLIRRALMIADDTGAEKRDRISAIRLAGELQGFVKKSVDTKLKVDGLDNDKFLSVLSERLKA